ncbi:hypothetical protein HHK36_018621 [Tetracentron sinense]|uniref:PX domain-containing protein n=1 Tax=Tetracentron sinense TaxID=13715 RepID=A0A834Z2J2_TETSI|nr:hypothetical protein HHK36_018621 [Tetracentron sinense]
MMGYENQGFEEAHLYASREEMENLVLEEPSTVTNSFSSYRSAMASLSEPHNPLSPPIITNDDPFLSPLPHRDHRNPNLSDHSYLEPPSYADAMFSPFNGEISDTNGIESPNQDSGILRFPSRSASLNSEYLKISVSNPLKEQETSNSLVPGGNTYVTYLITTRTNMPEFGGSEFEVRRRFKDVVTLSDRLSESYRGFLIPPRPDKNVVESQVMQKQEFVEQRRVALEKYLCRLAAHPVIKKSDELKVFLQVQGKLPLLITTDVASRMLDGAVNLPRQLFGESASVVALHEFVQPAKGGRDLLRIFKELKQSVTNDWGGSKPPVVEEDKEFLEKKEKLQDLEEQLSNASQQAESLVKAQQDIGETMGELGLAFVKLTKFETEEAIYNSQRIRAVDMKSVATASVKASRFYQESNAQTVKHLDTLHEYLGLMLSVHSAFSDRSSALLTVQTLLSELSSLHSRAEKLEAASSKIFGGDKSRIHKVEELKETIKVTEDAKSCAVREYERIKGIQKSLFEIPSRGPSSLSGILLLHCLCLDWRSKKAKTGESSLAPSAADTTSDPHMEIEEEPRVTSQMGANSSGIGATSSKGRKKKPTFSSLPVVPKKSPITGWRCSWKPVLTLYQKASPSLKDTLGRTSLGPFLTIPRIQSDRRLVAALCERWFGETNMFHFPCCELAITPLDFVMLTGIPIVGEVLPPLSAITMDQAACLMGVLPESIEADNAWEASKVKLSWLAGLLDNTDIVAIDINSLIFTSVFRNFLLYVLGACFFMTNRSCVDPSFLSLIDLIDRFDTFDWGGAIYASILVGLRRVSCWEGRLVHFFYHFLEVTLRPYIELGDMILLFCREARRFMGRRVTFSYFGDCEYFLGERVLHQSDGEFRIPLSPPLEMTPTWTRDAFMEQLRTAGIVVPHLVGDLWPLLAILEEDTRGLTEEIVNRIATFEDPVVTLEEVPPYQCRSRPDTNFDFEDGPAQTLSTSPDAMEPSIRATDNSAFSFPTLPNLENHQLYDRKLKQWLDSLDSSKQEAFENLKLFSKLGTVASLFRVKINGHLVEAALGCWSLEFHVFKLGVFELSPTLEEYGRLMSVPFDQDRIVIPFHRARWKSKATSFLGVKQGFLKKLDGEENYYRCSLKFLVDNFSPKNPSWISTSSFMGLPGSWPQYYFRALALAVVGHVLFPLSFNFIDMQVVEVVEQIMNGHSFIPMLLAETFRTLDRCVQKREILSGASGKHHLVLIGLRGSSHYIPNWIVRQFGRTQDFPIIEAIKDVVEFGSSSEKLISRLLAGWKSRMKKAFGHDYKNHLLRGVYQMACRLLFPLCFSSASLRR